ncbi:MerR family transcriptional regulator [Clostridium carboxidivorans P7]|uniref:Transcriptional regulator, MerR family n=1 Tax=Clostridium carboxidivorans P7 TaxID=536227 RepID=C6Q1B9_9CLOT|nr:MerR family transcriptional regulator [Clostridium carboxidivorans]AKN31528.1 MerR family transcriptional regulator [Clostridium carboxidivorans P7]EET84701.1 transcriptional regulator, MerR family [Clostridium carboxidivorans P7]EFG87066.1 transcriptional regulator, MerR family [Clostridium carboxidivorans P7]
MEKKKKIYNVIGLARIYGIHPNTVRLYEKLGFISKAKRNMNNYRIFEELHVLQIKVCRCIFGYAFTNRHIRNAGNEIMWSIAKKHWDEAEQNTDCYIQMIEQEIKKAQKSCEMLQNWANSIRDNEILLEKKMLSRKDIADYMGVTAEAIRNWERNGLILPEEVGAKGEKLYSSTDLGRIHIIYMLLQSGYSMASIHRSISMYDKGHAELVASALDCQEYDDFISVGDRWLYELNKLLEAAQKIPSIIEKLKNL